MISRIWHGWTTQEKADDYQQLLIGEILPGIKSRKIDGYVDAHLLRQDHDNEVEFITICWFEDWEAVKEFAGEDYEHSVVPPKARKLLSRYDETSQHYTVVKEPE